MKKILVLFLTAIINLNAETHTVTISDDDGFGSLRAVVSLANSGDTIIFAPNVEKVILSSQQITINKNLTIVGDKENKTAISGDYDFPDWNTGIFNVVDSEIKFEIQNLIIENGKTDARSGGVDIYGGHSNIFIAQNCVFKNNISLGGGAISSMYGYNLIVISDCLFAHNRTEGAGSAVVIINGFLYVKNSIFDNNGDDSSGTPLALFGNGTSFIATNNTFANNTAISRGSVLNIYSNYGYKEYYVYLHHNTLYKNYTLTNEGGAVHTDGLDVLHSYNSIYIANEVNGVVSEAGQIRGNVLGGENLIDNGTTITRETVFGDNEFDTTLGYIMPTEFAKRAKRLTIDDIEVPEGSPVSAETILSWLNRDVRGKERPDTGYVTFGAVEFDPTEISKFDERNYNVRIVPNPNDGNFSIIFDNIQEQRVSINLLDLTGRKFIFICDDIMPEGEQIINVSKNLSSGAYTVYLMIGYGYNTISRQVIITK